MAQPLPISIRELLLVEIKAQEPKDRSTQSLQQTSILDAVARKFGPHRGEDIEQAILTEWSELFRTGLLAWGLNISNPNPPFFHLTERSRQVLANFSRDPSNPAGYLRHLASVATLNPVAMSYLTEALECYVGGLFKAAAVMVGCAAESIILNLRDVTVQRLNDLGKTVPSKMGDWRIKTVSDALHSFFRGLQGGFNRELREPFEAYWTAFAQQIRTTRNDAGHPASIAPVTPDGVHASLLVFPELARLAQRLAEWVGNDFS